MTIKKVSKRPNDKKESAWDKTRRESKEKEERELEEERQRKIEESEEKQRVDNIARRYTEKLYTQLEEKGVDSFWVFPWKSGFKKLSMTKKEVQKLVKENPKKYQNKTICYTAIHAHHNEEETRIHRSNGTWLGVSLVITKLTVVDNIDDDDNKYWGCHFIWANDDFKITKFSFKLLEIITKAVDERKYECPSIFGIPIAVVIKNMKKKKVDFGDSLNPLANI